ncbi:MULTISPECIES: hypothetical protein [unclassified Blastococcus]
MSQPPYPQQPAAPSGGSLPPAAAPTQIGFPGQVQLAPQPQYAPTPQQAQSLQGGPLASGFPNYRSPQPSPPWMTGKIVGAIVVVLTIAFAVIGFLIVSGRGANSPEGAVTQFVQQLSERDAEGALDLVCEDAARETSETEVRESFAFLPPGEITVEINEVTDATQGELSGKNVNATVTAAGQSQEANFFVTEDKGWRVCGGDGAFI